MARASERTLSVELFPPKTTEGAERLRTERVKLAALRPSHVSITSGAMGSARTGTLELVAEVRRDAGLAVVPHLTCVGATRANVRELLAAYAALGVRRILVVRGDVHGSEGLVDFRHASDLVAFVRAEAKLDFHVDVAAHPEVHPEASSFQADLESFRRKVDAGASSATTQFFYNADAYFRFLESCDRIGVSIPIVPGVLPIVDRARLLRLAEANGVDVPRWLRMRLEGFGDDVASLQAFGVDVVLRLCRTLLGGGAPGLHFYTMNRAEPTSTIWRELGLARDAR